MNCIYCEKKMPEGGTSCYFCGKIQCIRCECGQELPRSAKFCMDCGKAVKEKSTADRIEAFDESYLEQDARYCPRRQECYGSSLLSPSLATAYQGYLYYEMAGEIHRRLEGGGESQFLFPCPSEMDLARLDVNETGIYLVAKVDSLVGIYQYGLDGQFIQKKEVVSHGLMVSTYIYGQWAVYVSRELREIPEKSLDLAQRLSLQYGDKAEVYDRVYLFDFSSREEREFLLEGWSGQYRLVYGGESHAVLEMTFEAEDEEDYFMDSAVGYYRLDFAKMAWTCLSHQRLYPHLLTADLPLYRKIYEEDYERGQTISFFHGGMEIFWTHNYKADVLEPRSVECPFQIAIALPLWRWNPQELFRRDISYFDGRYFFMNPSPEEFVSVNIMGDMTSFGNKSTTAKGFLYLNQLLYLWERDDRLWQYHLSLPTIEEEESVPEGILLATGEIFAKNLLATTLQA